MRSLVLLWLTSYLLATWAVDCPFPGITANAQFHNKSISWENRTSFQVNDVVEYDCVGDWKYIGKTNKYFLTCLSDGTWNRPLPKCRNQNIKIHLILDSFLLFHRSILVQGQRFAGNIYRPELATFMVPIQQLSFWSNVKLLSDQDAHGNQGTVTGRPEILRWYAEIFYTLVHNKRHFLLL